MHFSVIYSFDVPLDESVADHRPPKHRRKWDLTDVIREDDFKRRKYTALLSKADFLEFIRALDLKYDCETMGMIGAPGFGISWMPAVSFLSRDSRRCAYVCPVPDPGSQYYEDMKKLERYVERGFEVLRKADLS